MQLLVIILTAIAVVYWFYRGINALRKTRRAYSKSSSNDNADTSAWLYASSVDSSVDTSSHHASGHVDCSYGGDHSAGGDCGGSSH
jgi:hypothetical protein